ncbi:MAG: 50S ribosomal protein L3 [Alphaproteobacteria bacterium]|nr:50S ribosomal protein L3 [Alphaproteobacteria bacterium]MBL0718165.1 50S ribosomal protein L3 [Alphaproteobacteria bacterium]
MQRVGLIAIKKGMIAGFNNEGQRFPITVLQCDQCSVVNLKTDEKDGYNAVVLGFGKRKDKNAKRPQLKANEKNGIDFVAKKSKEFKVDKDQMLAIKTSVTVENFVKEQFVDVTGISKGKGFAGVMKRHGYAGLEATHGVQKSHRAQGSTGMGTKPGRVFPGRPMPGQMGNEQSTTLNLKVIAIDPEENLIFVKGAVPGSRGRLVSVRDAVMKGKYNSPLIKKLLADNVAKLDADKEGTKMSEENVKVDTQKEEVKAEKNKTEEVKIDNSTDNKKVDDNIEDKKAIVKNVEGKKDE